MSHRNARPFLRAGRAAALVLGAALATVLLSGCGEDGSTGGKSADGGDSDMVASIAEIASQTKQNAVNAKMIGQGAGVENSAEGFPFPIPQDGLTAVMEFHRSPQVLSGNTDVPRMPERFHMAIVWRAVMFWCAHDENPALWQSANQNYRELVNKMTITELPKLGMTEPLA